MMINLNLTPESGIIVLSGVYIWDESSTEKGLINKESNFLIELSWNSDVLVGTSIKRIIWVDEIPKEHVLQAEDQIRQVYNNLHRKPVILLTEG